MRRLLMRVLCRLGRHDLEERLYRMPANDIRRLPAAAADHARKSL